MDYTLGDTILYVENLNVQYDGVDIIKDVNLIEKDVIRPDQTTGQIIAFVGRSGRGKTTLFKALTGLVKPNAGQILIPEHDNPSIAKIVCEGDVGFVDQKYTLFRNKTVEETLIFALRSSTLTKEEKNLKIKNETDEWGLNGMLHKYPNQLSGGQRQRVAILEQMFNYERFIIMDEPFSGLDVGNIEKVKESFDLISKSNEFNTIVFSTHDIKLAVTMADSIYVIGNPTDEKGIRKNYGTVIRNYDLKQLGLAWGNEYTMAHMDIENKIREDLLNS